MKILKAVLIISTFLFFLANCGGSSSDAPITMVNYAVSNSIFPTNISHEYTGSFTITNSGDENGSENVDWDVYISTDNSFDTDDSLIDQGTINALNSTATSSTINYSGTFPMDSGSHDYYFIIQVSAGDDEDATDNEEISTAVNFNILFYESFENKYDNTWNISSLYTLSFDQLSGLTDGNPSDDGSYAFNQYNTDANPGDLFNNSNYITLSNITPKYARYYVRAGQTDKIGGYVAFWGPDPYPACVWVYMNNAPYFLANSQLVMNQGAYTANTWYKVELKDINFTDDTYDLYIDDTLVLENRAINGDATAFGAIALYNSDADSQFYYDDILIY